jgi:hypothetical protein
MLKKYIYDLRQYLILETKINFPKLYLFFLKIRYPAVAQKNIGELPWINTEAISWLKKNLNSKMKVFEYGSGGSTIFMAKIVEKITSVEYDAMYYLSLKTRLENENIGNCRLIYSVPKKNINDGQIFLTDDPKFENRSFKNYVQTINNFPNNYFDFVFIDGRARNGCVMSALPKVKDGGHILLDNSDLAEYNIGKKFLEKFEKLKFYGQVNNSCNNSETTIWKIKK